MKKALIVIDVQNEYINGKLQVTYPENSLDNITKAIKHAKNENIPIIIVQHTDVKEGNHTFIKGSYEWELHDSIKKVDADLYIEKNYPSAFVQTKLENYLRENNIDTIAICGYATQVCCDTTARYGVHLGFNVEFLYDATATLCLETKFGKVEAKTLFNAAVATQSMVFSTVVSVEEWQKCL